MGRTIATTTNGERKEVRKRKSMYIGIGADMRSLHVIVRKPAKQTYKDDKSSVQLLPVFSALPPPQRINTTKQVNPDHH